MSRVLINGKACDASLVDPRKHKFIGTFRSATVPNTKYVDKDGSIKYAQVYMCPCGCNLWDKQSVFSHWQLS